MRDQLTDQLRRYGEALEESVVAAEPRAVVAPLPWWSRHRRLLGVAACLIALAGGAAVVALLDTDSPTDVATTDQSSLVPSTTATSTTPPTTATTAVPPAVVPIDGIATWTAGPDPRGTLRVVACPAGEQEPCGPSLTATVGPDGSFTLLLPSDTATEWIVAAYVSVFDPPCLFNCEWRVAQIGPPSNVSLSQTPQPPLRLSVSARVLDVYVLDREGQPFQGGGLLIDDLRCSTTPCEEEFTPMFFGASGDDGAVRIVVDPSVAYEMHGQAMNTGWPDPQFYGPEGDAFWSSPVETWTGGDLTEGHVFFVNGGP